MLGANLAGKCPILGYREITNLSSLDRQLFNIDCANANSERKRVQLFVLTGALTHHHARKRTASASVPPQRCFVKELAGETPPTFQAMKRLYGLASDLYGLRPWQLLDEDNLIVVRDSVGGELCGWVEDWRRAP
jgi:hypothetical protein